MFTALASTILGLVGGLLPDVMKEVRDTRNSAREREFLRLQSELQLKQIEAAGNAKLQEIDAGAAADEARATREYLAAILESQGKPTGIVWIDGFNAMLRPVCVVLVMSLFIATAIPFVWAVIGQYYAGQIEVQTMANTIWTSLVGESIQAVLGYLWGYRSVARPRPATAV
jgi:hypothetical protein